MPQIGPGDPIGGDPTQPTGWEKPIHCGKRIYKMIPDDNYFTCTNAAVNHDFQIAEPHRLINMEVQHTAAAGTLSTDALTWSFNRMEGSEMPNAVPLESVSESTQSNFHVTFGEKWEKDKGQYRFIENSTNTDRVYVILYIQMLR